MHLRPWKKSILGSAEPGQLASPSAIALAHERGHVHDPGAQAQVVELPVCFVPAPEHELGRPSLYALNRILAGLQALTLGFTAADSRLLCTFMQVKTEYPGRLLPQIATYSLQQPLAKIAAAGLALGLMIPTLPASADIEVGKSVFNNNCGESFKEQAAFLSLGQDLFCDSSKHSLVHETATFLSIKNLTKEGTSLSAHPHHGSNGTVWKCNSLSGYALSGL